MNNPKMLKINKNMLFMILLIGGIVFCLSSVSGFNESTFNNSLTSESLTFTGFSNITRYLDVPQGVFITNALTTILSYPATKRSLFVGSILVPDSNRILIGGTGGTIDQDGLVAWYKMDEGTGTKLVDSALGIYNATLINSPSYVQGVYGTAIKLDGSTQYGNITTRPMAELNYVNGVTIMAWINQSSTQTGVQAIIEEDGGVNNRLFNLRIDDGVPTFVLYNYNNYQNIVTATGKIQTGVWHHIAGTYNVTGISIYIDGILNKSQSFYGDPGTASPNELAILEIGNGNAQFFNGSIDDIIVRNVGMNSTQIIQDMNNGNSVPLNLSYPDTINQYLSTCTYINGVCSVPFNFHSDNAGILNYSNLNFNNTGSLNINETVPDCPRHATCYETSQQSFRLNVSYDTDYYGLSYATFYLNVTPTKTLNLYNAITTYHKNGAVYDITFDMPVTNLTIDLPYFWEINLVRGTTAYTLYHGINSTGGVTLNVSEFVYNLYDCTYGGRTPRMNFTVYDEKTIGRIYNYSFDGTFDFWLGSGAVKKSISISRPKTNDTWVCSNDPLQDVQVDAKIQYSDMNSTLYTPRNYYLEGHNVTTPNSIWILGIAEQFEMYLLNKTYATSFIMNVLDKNNLPVSNALINTLRFYPGEGISRVVQISKTDSSGNTLGLFETETPDYSFIITRNTSVVLTTVKQKIFPTATPYTLFFNLANNLEYPWAPFQNKSNIQYAGPTFDNDTKMITFSYIDTSGLTNYVRLLVKQQNAIKDKVICDVESTQSAAILTCNVTGYNGQIQADAFISRSPESPIITVVFAVTTALRDAMGTMGYYMGWLIIIVMFMVGIYNFTVGIVTGTVSLWFVSMFGLISFPLVFLFSWTFMAIIIIWWGKK